MAISRRSTKRAAVAAALATGLVLSGSSIAGAATTEPSAQPDTNPSTLRVATSGFVDTMNPFISIYLTPTQIIRYTYENLVQWSNEDGSPAPGLAESWDASEDGKTWTFTLHPDMKWSDGEPLTAEDVVYTYQLMLDDQALQVSNGSEVDNLASIEATDDRTVVMQLENPQAANPGTGVPVVPKHIWENIDDKAGYANDKDVVGSGPFVLASYDANQQIVLTANEHFWAGKPKMDRIQFIYYTNADARIQALRSGDVDLVTSLSATQFETLQGAEGITTQSGINRRYSSIAINPGYTTRDGQPFGNGSAALHEKEVRQAIRLGIDTETLRDKIFKGNAQPATAFIPSSYPDWHLKEDNPVIVGYDPEAAKQLLDGAGWVPGADGIREKDGQRLSIRLGVNADSATENAMAEFIVEWLKEIGIEVQRDTSDSDTLMSEMDKGNFDLAFSGWGLDPDPNYQLGINTCAQRPTNTDGTGGTTQSGYCNPEFDRLYEQQKVEMDHNKRMEIVQEMQAMWYDEAVEVVYGYVNSLEAYRSDRVEGWTLMPADGGMIYGQAGNYGFRTVAPVGEGGNQGGLPVGAWIAIGAVVLLGLAGLVYAMMRRRTSDDRE